MDAEGEENPEARHGGTSYNVSAGMITRPIVTLRAIVIAASLTTVGLGCQAMDDINAKTSDALEHDGRDYRRADLDRTREAAKRARAEP